MGRETIKPDKRLTVLSPVRRLLGIYLIIMTILAVIVFFTR
jgi:hypothetical protein